jgi:hypothetical protein
MECNFSNGKAYGDLKMWTEDGKFFILGAEKAEEYIKSKYKFN